LPFRDAAFDAVMLIQLFGGMRGWRQLLEEARRVLRPAGALVLGRSVVPPDGVDAQMKRRLARVLDGMGVQADGAGVREDVQRWLEANARGGTCAVAATWSAERTARGFLERHRTGARFSTLPPPVKQTALRKLSAWASEAYGSLDAAFCEPHAFELRVFRFNKR
jgi:SAM-dependent methyltransferase